jgi:hypothetical protein
VDVPFSRIIGLERHPGKFFLADLGENTTDAPVTKAQLLAKVKARLAAPKKKAAAQRLTEDTMSGYQAVKDVVRALPPGPQRDEEEAILRRNLEEDLRALAALRPLQDVEKAWWKRVLKKPLP